MDTEERVSADSANLNSSLAYEAKDASQMLLENDGKLFDWVGRWGRILDVFTVTFQNDVALEKRSTLQYLSDCGQSCEKIKKQIQILSKGKSSDLQLRNLPRERNEFFKSLIDQMQKCNHTISSIRKFKVNYKSEAAEGDGVAKSFLSQLQEELVKTGEKLTKVC